MFLFDIFFVCVFSFFLFLHSLLFILINYHYSPGILKDSQSQLNLDPAGACLTAFRRFPCVAETSALDAKANYPERCALSGTGSWLKNSTRSAAVVVAGYSDKSELLHLCACRAREHCVHARAPRTRLGAVEMSLCVTHTARKHAAPDTAVPLPLAQPSENKATLAIPALLKLLAQFLKVLRAGLGRE